LRNVRKFVGQIHIVNITQETYLRIIQCFGRVEISDDRFQKFIANIAKLVNQKTEHHTTLASRPPCCNAYTNYIIQTISSSCLCCFGAVDWTTRRRPPKTSAPILPRVLCLSIRSNSILSIFITYLQKFARKSFCRKNKIEW